jgi:IstB-like ATP binding protein
MQCDYILPALGAKNADTGSRSPCGVWRHDLPGLYRDQGDAMQNVSCPGCLAAYLLTHPETHDQMAKRRAASFCRVAPDLAQSTVAERLPDWLRTDLSFVDGRSIHIRGPSGAGKTRALWLAVFTGWCLYGRKFRVVSHMELNTMITASMDNGHIASLISDLIRAPVLAVDDLGNGSMTETQWAKLLEIIDGRYRAGRPIYVSTQYDKTQMETKIGRDKNEALRRRLVDMKAVSYRPKD